MDTERVFRACFFQAFKKDGMVETLAGANASIASRRMSVFFYRF